MKYNVIIIGGPTASGKSALGLMLARAIEQQLGIKSEIVNADGMQVYNQLKTLTAQPSKSDLELVPHNLYSILEPEEKISVYDWCEKAQAIISKLEQENKIAIVVGGTGFYINSLCYGQPTVPKVPDEIREMTRALFDKIGRDEFYNKLLLIDHRISEVIKKGDTQRLLRTYEVYKYTGKSIIDFWDGPTEEKPNILKIFLHPPRALILNKIRERTNQMIANNVLDEILFYKDNYKGIDSQLNNALGYKELGMYIDGLLSLEDAVRLANIESAHYAKRQVTWFRNKMPNAESIEAVDQYAIESILKAISK